MAVSSELPLPRASAYDPPTADEGRLDPLGLASVADRIADSYARPLRARMRRVRFLTTMALGGLFINDLAGVKPAVAGDTPDVALERIVVECLARSNSTENRLDSGIPGITKAHAALLSKSRLSARGYLKSPRVFGFFGVYRPLAAAIGLTDSTGGTLATGASVLQALEKDQQLNGLANVSHGSVGSGFIDWLTSETGKALETGGNAFSPRSPFVDMVTKVSNPGAARKRERAALSKVLANPMPSLHPSDEESYLEVLSLLSSWDSEGWSEVNIAEYLLNAGTAIVKARMQMLIHFEEFARDITWAFADYRYLAGRAFGGVPSNQALSDSQAFGLVAQTLSTRFRTALGSMNMAIEFGVDPGIAARFSESFGQFGDVTTASEAVEIMMIHHTSIQRNKAPHGKRAWLEETNNGWAVRPMFTVEEPPERNKGFVHPYRLNTFVNFLADVHE